MSEHETPEAWQRKPPVTFCDECGDLHAPEDLRNVGYPDAYWMCYRCALANYGPAEVVRMSRSG